MQLEKNKMYARVVLLFLSSTLAFWMFSIAIHDILEPSANFKFASFILAGSNDYALSLHITNHYMLLLAFLVIIVLESIIAIIFIISSYAILKSLCQNELNKKFLFMGLLLGLMKYLLFFTAGATEWFYVWQTKNSFKSDSMLISAILLLSLIIVIITE